MPKITFIGAGSLVFTRNLCNDILITPALEGSILSLVDIDAERLAGAKQIVEALVQHRGVKATVEATLDRKAALSGSDYVVTTFQQGGLEAYQTDIEIPKRYGVRTVRRRHARAGRRVQSTPHHSRATGTSAPKWTRLPQVPCCLTTSTRWQRTAGQ